MCVCVCVCCVLYKLHTLHFQNMEYGECQVSESAYRAHCKTESAWYIPHIQFTACVLCREGYGLCVSMGSDY